MNEIVDPAVNPSASKPPSNRLKPTTEAARQAGIAARSARHAHQRAETFGLGSATCYPDSPPGIGWVLKHPNHPKRYLATRDKAIAHYQHLVATSQWSP